MEATHRGLYKFVPRHRDEMEVDIGDPIYVQKEADDCWCEGKAFYLYVCMSSPIIFSVLNAPVAGFSGVNLRTGTQGAFPSAYAVDVDYADFDSTTPKVKRERFLLGYMGSVETMWHKGNSVLCQAIRKMTERPNCKPQSCILEVSDQGLRMVDRAKSSTTVSELSIICIKNANLLKRANVFHILILSRIKITNSFPIVPIYIYSIRPFIVIFELGTYAQLKSGKVS